MTNAEMTSIILRLTSSDLRIIEHVLMPYVKETCEITLASPQRNEWLSTIAAIRQRTTAVKTLAQRGTPQEFSFSHAELTVIDRALTACMVKMNRWVPQSAERDEILRQFEALRVSILSGRTSPVASP